MQAAHQQISHSIHRSVDMLVSVLTEAAVQMIAHAVTILSTLVQLLAASAITIVTPLAVTMHTLTTRNSHSLP